MFLSDEAIQQNKEEFLTLVNSITREGFKKEELISKLENSDFFVAPASTRFHGSYKGGLCDHCLNVYHNLVSLVEKKHLTEEINPESIKIVALFHDFSKMNYYKIDYRNKKVYCQSGSKKDNGGNYDWVVEQSYATVPVEERFVFGSHEETSEFMTRTYIPLSYDESAAILNHHFGMGFDSTKADMSSIATRYPLMLLLHLADMLAAYIDEA